MIFADSNVFIYAVGRPHPLREEARAFFLKAGRGKTRIVTSAEVLQELLHVYLPVGRLETLDHALQLATRAVEQVLPLSDEDVLYARTLVDGYPALTARDLIHLALCRRNGISRIMTFDRGLKAAFRKTK